MKKLLLFASLFTSISFKVNSQQLNVPMHNTNKCGSAQIHEQLMQTDPAYALRMQTYENYVASLQHSAQKTMGVVYKVPVVVHVLHKGEAVGTGVNVSDAAIQNAIQDLNEMYRKVPGTQGDGNGVDVEIEYALAVRDPSGNCTNGITRHDMTGNATYMTYGVKRNGTNGITDAAAKAIGVWDQTKYYNIWLVSEIDDNNGGAGIQGYAYFASSHGTSVDGALILSSNFTSGTSTTAAHELGHSLNLYHTFEGDGTGASCPTNPNGCGSGVGDCCGDIPAHKRSNSDCISGTNSCTGTSTDLYIHNYMDYSSDVCQNMLTANQKTRMVSAISTTRASFLSPENGGTNMALVPVSTAGVDFSASASILCGTGQSIKFMDKSTCVPNSYTPYSSFSGITYLWTITNGVNTYTSSAQNPVITFTNTGTFNVTLQVTNSFGTTSASKTAMIVVASGAPVAGCTPSSSNSGNYWQTIYNTTFNTFSSSTSQYVNTAYTDLSCTYNTIVTSGSTYSLSISANAAGGSGTEYFEVYIDYNNNGVFSNPSEMVFSGNAPSGTSVTSNTTITIPGTAVQNTLLRMRVIADATTISSGKRSCTSAFFVGDVEDYGVYIKSSACTTPTVTVTPSTATICAGQSTTLTASGATTYTWMPGSLTGASAVVSPTATTVYTLTGSTGTCVSTPKTVTVTVNSIPVVTLTPTSSTICAGQSTTITASGATTYTWLPSGSGSSSVVTPTATTVYTVTGTSSGCTSAPKTSTVIVNSVPVLTITPTSATICSGQSTTITASGASTYTWLPSGSGSSSVVSPTATTVYTITGSNASCTSTPKTATINVNSTPVLTVTPTTATICSGQSTTLTASGASTYTWLPSGSGSSSVVSPTATTVYTITGSNGSCVGTPKTAAVTVNSAPVLTITPTTATICSGQSATLTASGASTYTWLPSGSGNSSVVSPTATTVYTITGNNGSCNSAPKTATVNVNTAPVLTITPTSATICSGQSTTITASGASTYTWLPSGSGTSSVVSPTATTVYTITGSNGSCVSAPKTATVNVSSAPVLTITPTSATICSGQSSTITASGASTYTWLPSGSGSSSVVSPTATTVYTITGSNGSCASAPKTATVNVNSLPVTVASTNGTITCTAATATVNSSLAGMTYTWTAPAGGSVTSANNQNTSVTGAGTYTINVVNPSTGCTYSTTTSVTQNTTAPTGVSAGPNRTLTCASSSVSLTGSVTTPTNATASWTGGVCGSTTAYTTSACAAGIYTLTATNPANGCTASSTVQVFPNSGSPSVATSATGTLTCANPTRQVIATTTVSPVSYNWTGPGVVSGATTASATVNASGQYTVVVTNTSSGCSTTSMVTVSQNTVAPSVTSSASGTLTCSNATINVVASTTATPVSYAWTGPGIVSGASTASATVNQAGTYNYTVTNTSNGCVRTGTQSAVQNTVTPSVASSTTGTLTCTTNTVRVVASTTTSPVSYAWTGPGIVSGASTASATVNQAGTYNYTVTNTSNGCVRTGTQAATQNTTAPTGVSAGPNRTLTCASSSVSLTGSITTPTNATVSWTGGVCGSTTAYTTSACAAGIYTLTATNPANGCTASSTVQVFPNSGSPSVATSATGTLTCANPTRQVIATTTVSPVSYSWTGPGIVSGATTASATVNAAGQYTVVVTNTSSGCSTTSMVAVSQNTVAPSVTSSASGTLTCSNATINVVASTTATPVSYAWTGPGIISGASSATASVNQGGTYNYTVTNTSNGCVRTGTQSVVQNTVTPSAVSSTTGSLTCTTNTVRVVASTTTSPVSYAWTGPGIVSGASTASATVNQAGTYNYTVTNTSNGCFVTGAQSVTQNTVAPTGVSAGSNATLTCGSPSVALNGSVGSPTNATVSWTGGVCGSTTNLNTFACTAGTYTLTATNPANGCKASSTVQVFASASAPVVTNNPVTNSITCTNVTVSVSISTTATPVSYAWTGAGIVSGAGTSNITVDQGGVYNYTVTNTSNGCSTTGSQAVSSNTVMPSYTLSPMNSTICAGNSQVLTVATASANSTLWSTGETTSVITVTPSSMDVFTVTVTDPANGCSATSSATVDVTPIPVVSISPSNTTICNGSSVSLNASGATSYTWSPSGSGSSNVVSPSANMVYTVTGAVGSCVGTAVTATVDVVASPTLAASTSNTLICTGETATLTVNGDATSYIWSPAATLSSSTGTVVTASPTITITYTVTGTLGSCSSMATVAQNVSTCTGIASITSSNEAVVFPNPSNGGFTLAYGSNVEELTVEVYNTIGQTIRTQKAENVTELSVDLTKMASGIYYLKASTKDGSKLFKLILE